jgi:hypothetical protein
MLIPTDPVNFETYSEVHGGSKVKHDLLEFYHDHVNKKKDKQKHIRTATELQDML